jgi:Rad3-related DNA helicase
MQTKNDEKMIEELGETLKTIAASVQGGILMFFASYSYMG